MNYVKKIMKECVGFREKTYRFLIDFGSEDYTKGTKKCVIRRNFKPEDYENCLEVTRLENETNHLEKSKIDVDSLKRI